MPDPPRRLLVTLSTPRHALAFCDEIIALKQDRARALLALDHYQRIMRIYRPRRTQEDRPHG